MPTNSTESTGFFASLSGVYDRALGTLKGIQAQTDRKQLERDALKFYQTDSADYLAQQKAANPSFFEHATSLAQSTLLTIFMAVLVLTFAFFFIRAKAGRLASA